MKKIFRSIFFKGQSIRIWKYKILSSPQVKLLGKPTIKQPLLLVGCGTLKFLGNAKIGFYSSPYYFNGYAHFDFRRNNAEVIIGNDVWLNNSSVLIADNACIKIGDKTIAGTNLSIYTSDFHHLDPAKRMETGYPSDDVVIGSNVFIGSNVTILKGVTIGDNSVIANGSMVTKSIPSNAIAAGIPCKVIKSL